VQTTTLFEKHQSLGATFTDFGGWNMPVRYGSDLDEHHAVRNSAGLFDISHMAEIAILGDAEEFLDFAVVSKVSALADGRAKYTMICEADGGVIDDLIVYRVSAKDYLIIANASNRKAVVKALGHRKHGFNVDIQDISDDFSLLAFQGPKSAEILQSLITAGSDGAKYDLSNLKYYAIAPADVAGISVMIARTGYTGEDGFEILVANSSAEEIWDLISQQGVSPCGLASRDTLRLEAGMPLYGHELESDLTPFEAGLEKIISFDKDFVGKAALQAKVDKTPARKLYALKGEGRRAARADYEIFLPGSESPIGKVTSGVLSPTLGYPIAMAYLLGELDLPIGSKLEADVRGTKVEYEVVAMPFYKRGR
jgi:aminomethyltransferase